MLISALRHAAEFQAKGHVLVDRHVRVQGVVLEDHGDVAVLGRDIVDDAFADADGAAGDLLQPGDHAQRRGLAAAGGADQHDEFPVGDVQVDGIDGFDAAGIDFADIVQFDYSHSSFPAKCSPTCGNYTGWLKMVNFGGIGVAADLSISTEPGRAGPVRGGTPRLCNLKSTIIEKYPQRR